MTTRSPALLVSLLAVLVAAAGLTGCAGPAEQLPAGPELLTRSADAMAKVTTIAVDAQADPALTALPIRSADARLTVAGDAVGSAVLNQGGSGVEFQFVVTQGTLYLKGPTGAYQRLPLALAAGIYDPTALLRPDTGMAGLLRTATGAVTEAVEDVNGAPAYKVRATFDRRAVQSVLPGISGATTGLVWLDKATSRLVKAQVDVPVGRGDAQGAVAPVTVTLSDFDVPVTVTPPA